LKKNEEFLYYFWMYVVRCPVLQCSERRGRRNHMGSIGSKRLHHNWEV